MQDRCFAICIHRWTFRYVDVYTSCRHIVDRHFKIHLYIYIPRHTYKHMCDLCMYIRRRTYKHMCAHIHMCFVDIEVREGPKDWKREQQKKKESEGERDRELERQRERERKTGRGRKRDRVWDSERERVSGRERERELARLCVWERKSRTRCRKACHTTPTCATWPVLCVTWPIHTWKFVSWRRVLRAFRVTHHMRHITHAHHTHTSPHHVRVVTYLHVWRDACTCVQWLIHVCDVAWFVHMCKMTQSYAWQDSRICVMWRIHICLVTQTTPAWLAVPKSSHFHYGVATISRLLKITGLLCKKAL